MHNLKIRSRTINYSTTFCYNFYHNSDVTYHEWLLLLIHGSTIFFHNSLTSLANKLCNSPINCPQLSITIFVTTFYYNFCHNSNMTDCYHLYMNLPFFFHPSHFVTSLANKLCNSSVVVSVFFNLKCKFCIQ